MSIYCNAMSLVLVVLVAFAGQTLGQITLPNEPIKDALYLHNTSISNNTLRDCVYKPATRLQCPDADIRHILYSNDQRQEMKFTESVYWLRNSTIWDKYKEDIVIIHGYASGDDTPFVGVIRDAYLQNGSYNILVVDWSALAQPPCYTAAVYNLRAVARCTANLLNNLMGSRNFAERITCVGHSLGAHICGLISRFLTFNLNRIIALDPARPLVTTAVKLGRPDANAVHVFHTNAGHYGEIGRTGHVDFCINGGKTQPYCKIADFDENLCSHIWALCYLAESINPDLARLALPCSRRCPSSSVPVAAAAVGPARPNVNRPGNRNGKPVVFGQFTPLSASGTYCIHNSFPPYCPVGEYGLGDKRCCLKGVRFSPYIMDITI